MIIPVKQKRSPTLVISTQNWSILAKFAKKKTQRNRLFFTDCFLAKFPPEISREIGRFSQEFAPENPSKIDFFPLKFREMGQFFCKFWLFSRENCLKSADCSANFEFFPAKILRNRPIFPWICLWKSREILLFSPRNIRSPDYSKSHSFWMVKICSKIHTCSQKQSCWLPPFHCVIKQWSIIKSAINQLLFNHLVNDIQSKRGNQQVSFWLAHMNLAMHFDRSKLRNLDFL